MSCYEIYNSVKLFSKFGRNEAVYCILCSLEPAFLVYSSERNRGVTIRLHSMMTLGWIVGAVKSILVIMQNFHGRYAPLSPSEGRVSM